MSTSQARCSWFKGKAPAADLIVKALAGSKARGGTALDALMEAMQAGGYDVQKNKATILLNLKRGVASQCLAQVKGSYRLNKAKVVVVAPAAKKPEKAQESPKSGEAQESPKSQVPQESPKSQVGLPQEESQEEAKLAN